jgi:hypothetical protein
LIEALGFEFGVHGGKKRIPCADSPSVAEDLGTIRVVEAQYRGLHKSIGRTEARRMFRVSLDFGGTAHVAFHENTAAIAGERHRRGIEERPAKDDLQFADVKDIFSSRGQARSSAPHSGRQAKGAYEL